MRVADFEKIFVESFLVLTAQIITTKDFREHLADEAVFSPEQRAEQLAVIKTSSLTSLGGF